MGTAPAPNRRYRQNNRNGAQYEEKRRHRHKMQSNVVQNRKQKWTFNGGVIITPKIRKGMKRSSRRDARGIRGRLGDDGVRHRSTKAKLHSEFDIDEMSYVYVIGICTKAVVDFFRGVLSGW